jgi:hypothetical protein
MIDTSGCIPSPQRSAVRPPWSVEAADACLIGCDGNQALAYVISRTGRTDARRLSPNL